MGKAVMIYICDDEIPVLRELAEKIQKCVPEEKILCFSSGMELREQLGRSSCDFLFLDIDMPDVSGMEIAEGLMGEKGIPLLVFVTSHDELVYESFQYRPFAFIRKGFFDQEIGKVLKRGREHLESLDRKFYFRMEGRDVSLLLSDILYFEADGNYLKICTVSGDYRARGTVSDRERELYPYGFVRIHKGFLVNQTAVRMIGREEVELKDGTVLPVGKHYAGKSKRQLLEYMRV
jgi:Response regulator of the LytR/AlgR family